MGLSALSTAQTALVGSRTVFTSARRIDTSLVQSRGGEARHQCRMTSSGRGSNTESRPSGVARIFLNVYTNNFPWRVRLRCFALGFKQSSVYLLSVSAHAATLSEE